MKLLGSILFATVAVAPPPDELAFFERDVRPILVERCYECHSAAGKRKGGLHLDSRAAVLIGGDSGAALVPGQPEQSLLLEAIGYQNHDLQMPPKNPLSAAEIAILHKWVTMGAPDPRTEVAAMASEAQGMSLADGRKFWAFQPVRDPPVPSLPGDAWGRTPIDAFALANGLEPAPSAQRHELLRRITFDLIGLPPTPEELADFLADESPVATTTSSIPSHKPTTTRWPPSSRAQRASPVRAPGRSSTGTNTRWQPMRRSQKPKR